MTLAMRLFGVKETLDAFRDLPRAVGNQNMRIAMNAGAGIIRDAAAIRVPIGSALLRNSLKVKVRVPDASFNAKHHGRPAYAVIGPSRRFGSRVAQNRAGQMRTITTKQAIRRSFGGGGFTFRRPSRYAHLVHGGTRSHVISTKEKRTLSTGEVAFGRKVNHPGTRPNDFLAAAVRTSGTAAQMAVIGKLKSGISEWVSRRALQLNTPWGRGSAAMAA